MKKIVALMHKGRDATAMAQNILAKMGLARHNAGCRVGAADPEGMVKLAIGPITHEATCEFIQDFLDLDPGVATHSTADMVNATELDTAVLPDLLPYVPPYVPPDETVTPDVPKDPIREAPRQVTEPEVERLTPEMVAKMPLAKLILELGNTVKFLGLDASVVAKAVAAAGGVAKTEIVFPDGSVLRTDRGGWEVA